MGITEQFLNQFYGDGLSEESRAAVWLKDGKRHHWCGSVEEIVKVAERHSDKDVYFTMAVFPPGSRRTQEKAMGIFGCWLDLDIGDKGNGRDY